MPVNDVYRSAIQYGINGEKCANVLHFIQTSGDGGANVVAELAQAIITSYVPQLAAFWSNDVLMQAVTSHRIDPTIGGSVVIADATPGGVASDTLPPNSCLVATMYSDHLTGRGRGRIFISGLSDSYTKNGRLLNTSPPDIVTFLGLLTTTLAGANGTTFRCGVWSTTGVIFHEYTSHQLRARLVTLRSRRMANP